MNTYEIVTEHRGHHLRVYMPQAQEVRRYAEMLAHFYNDEHNRVMMDHSDEHTPEDILELYADTSPDTIRFFIEADGVFLGDADLRHIDRARRTAEYAVMIGARAAQGKGWGTRVTIMITYFAFAELDLQTVYLSVIPTNVAGRRAYEKVGYQRDHSEAGKQFREHPDDIVMSVDRATFMARHGDVLSGITIRRQQ